MNDAYLQGFLLKCAEEGIDAEALLKVAQNSDEQLQLQLQNAYNRGQQPARPAPMPARPASKPIGRLPSLNTTGAEIYNYQGRGGGRAGLARASVPTNMSDPRISGPGGVIEQARAQTPWGENPARYSEPTPPAVARQAGPQVARGGQQWKPTSPAEKAMMATRGRPSNQQGAAYRQTLAQGQGFSQNQQRIAGMPGGTVKPYGTMAPGRPAQAPAAQRAQNVAKPPVSRAAPAAQNVAKSPAPAPAPAASSGLFSRMQTPNLSPYGPDPVSGRFRMETPKLNPFG